MDCGRDPTAIPEAGGGRPGRVYRSGPIRGGARTSLITTLYLAGGLASFQRIVDSESYSHPFGTSFLTCCCIPIFRTWQEQ